jgi:hypothetical protein
LKIDENEEETKPIINSESKLSSKTKSAKNDEFEMNQSQLKIDENAEEVKSIINSKSMKMNQTIIKNKNHPKKMNFNELKLI